ncbi:hypothetical protein SAMN05443248_7444 [Bradyrhizobium erythrophlei]|uniref:Uncharacterized protein n=1 Tax=Bradyrhizobium erythrophlei TaxID=1437360 RepID=A0A1M5XLF5_9BRAD|nr:hypothetical protein SAMN05443248_7444 [Bradyrhizobium erythrophlei]
MARCEYSCAYLLPHAHTRLRVHRAPGIPHALWSRGRRLIANLGRVAPRDREGVFAFAVIASEAKQSTLSFLLYYGLLRFARNDGLTIIFAPWLFEKLNPISAVPKAGRPSPLPLWERSDRIVRCDPGEGLRTIDRPQPLTPTLESELRSSRSHKGQRELTAVAGTLGVSVMDCIAEPIIGRAFARAVGSR